MSSDFFLLDVARRQNYAAILEHALKHPDAHRTAPPVAPSVSCLKVLDAILAAIAERRLVIERRRVCLGELLAAEGTRVALLFSEIGGALALLRTPEVCPLRVAQRIPTAASISASDRSELTSA
jgi:hypothetical protein